jgi:hypothetical protein
MDYVHFFDYHQSTVTVEASLLHTFTRKPGGYPLCARWICNESLEASVEFYKQHSDEIRAELLAKGEVSPIGETSPLAMTIWARTTLIQSLLHHHELTTNYDGFTRTKVRQFVERHEAAKPLQTTAAAPPQSSSGDIKYTPLGNSEYPDDRSLRKKHRQCMPNHEFAGRPEFSTGDCIERYAAMIRTEFTDDELLETFAVGKYAYDPLDFPRDVAAIIRRYSIYCGCIIAMHYGEVNTHALIDLFYNCLTYDKMEDAYLLGEGRWWSFWYYPLEARVFTADYLPDYFHTLAHMAFSGENDSPEFPLMLIWSKCMPFACQQRDLMKDLYTYCTKNAAFWRFFSKLMWCMLVGLYPNCTSPITDMRALLRIKHLCDNRTLLMHALCRGDGQLTAVARKERERNAVIVATAFRLYTTHLIRYNPHFAESFADVVDWETFEKVNLAKKAKPRSGFAFFCK